jgi:hypothetical protein
MVNRWVMVAFILVVALVPAALMSVDDPWIRCMIQAPLSIPFFDAAMKSLIAVRPVQVV